MNRTKKIFCVTLNFLVTAMFCTLAVAQDNFSGEKTKSEKIVQQEKYSVATNNFPEFPAKKNPLRIGEFQAMYAGIANAKIPIPKVYATQSGEDWKTQGDWFGRITSEYAILCAMDAPFDHLIYHNQEHYRIVSFMGPNHDYEEAIDEDDELRYWLHWRRTEDRRALWTPFYAFRRQAEWDDHGEVYPLTKDGPDIWYLLDIKHTGIFEASMYFYNKDGHDHANRLRDYVIEVYPSPKAWSGVFEDRPVYGELAEKQVSKIPPLSKARVNMFWGGVHKKFTLAGPGSYFVKIDRNNSYNTIISAAMIRQVHGEPTWLVRRKKIVGMPRMALVPYDPPPLPEKDLSNAGENIILFWKLLEEKGNFHDVILKQYRYRLALYRTAVYAAERNAIETDKQLAKSLKWRLNQWDEEQRKEYIEVMLRGWRADYLSNGAIRDMIKDNRKRFPHIYKEPRYDENTYPELKEKNKNLTPSNPNKER